MAFAKIWAYKCTDIFVCVCVCCCYGDGDWPQVEQCRHLAEKLILSYPECDTPGLIQAAQYVRQKNTGQAIECLQVRFCAVYNTGHDVVCGSK